MESLKEYKTKRNFSKTAEPPGQIAAPTGALEYCVQHHMSRREHYDFRLEWNGVLLSWAVPKGPSFNPADKRLAVRVEDHPLDYRDFEGTIPMGEYGGGTVMLWDTGTWTPLGDAAAGLTTGRLKFTLNGHRLRGNWNLIRTTGYPQKQPPPAPKSQASWLLIKESDIFAKDNPAIAHFTKSIKSGRTMDEIRNSAHID